MGKYFSSAAFVHRDFKPDNVLVGKDGRAPVADFGLARGLRSEDPLPAVLPGPPDRPPLVSPLTLQGAILGTPEYMSPEQHRGETADSRSDQWSFCAALYAALYGLALFAGDTLAALSANVQAGRLRPAPAISMVPARINAALRRGMAAAPEERYASMAELSSALAVDPQRDPALAPMTRRSFVIPMLLGMGAVTILMYLLRAQRWLTPARLVASAGILLLSVSGMALGLRRSLRENSFHLGLVKLMIVLLAQLFMVRGAGFLLGQGVTHILTTEQVVLAGSDRSTLLAGLLGDGRCQRGDGAGNDWLARAHDVRSRLLLPAAYPRSDRTVEPCCRRAHRHPHPSTYVRSSQIKRCVGPSPVTAQGFRYDISRSSLLCRRT